jgi:predicted RNA-binding Zn-ribbon protein involved in translation (DUF1610 family)
MKKETYSEISEKKTSKLGYLLLIALFIFLIIIGQTVFQDIRRIPERPKGPASCISSYTGSLKTITRTPKCSFTEIDKKFNLEALVTALIPEVRQIIAINKKISGNRNQIRTNDRTLKEVLGKYNLSLQETIANEDALMDKPEIKKHILSLRESNAQLRSAIHSLNKKRDGLIKEIDARIRELSAAHQQAKDLYSTKVAYYKFKIFLLKLLFVLPFFLIFLRLYLKFKRKDSPYTIIVTSVFYASTILLLEIVLIFLYDILPKQWLERIFRFLMESPVLRYILYYGSAVLVILLLGGIVYFIQKKIYNPKRVALRHLKNGKCPGCSLDLRLAEKFCPNCGRAIRSECPECSHLQYRDLPSCPHCGHSHRL